MGLGPTSSFDGANTTCYLAQFYNAVYVMNGDSSNPSSVYIYNAGSKSWSTQSVTTGNFNPSSFNAILDHDTNVFYALSQGELYFLDMGSMTSANSSSIAWVDVEKAPYPSSYTSPVMALAQNHIHFLDIPGVQAGSAEIFVIHCKSTSIRPIESETLIFYSTDSYFQPTAQSYPLSNGSAFPATHGQTASFFQQSGVQQEFAFIPDDGSATYVINVETNSTDAYAGPPTKDPKATYAAGITSLVQLDSTGTLMFLPYQEGNVQANTQASWTKVAAVASVAPPSSSSAGASATGSHSGSGSAASATKSGAGATGSTTPGSNSSSNSGSIAARISRGLVAAGVLGIVACVL